MKLLPAGVVAGGLPSIRMVPAAIIVLIVFIPVIWI